MYRMKNNCHNKLESTMQLLKTKFNILFVAAFIASALIVYSLMDDPQSVLKGFMKSFGF